MIVDANVLIYAVNADAPFHVPAKDWLEGALSGPRRIALPWASIVAFQRIATHPRASRRPLAPARAWWHLPRWLDADTTWIPLPGPKHAAIFAGLVADGDLRGNLATDAHLAALAIEHAIGVCSFDSDFARFPGVAWHRHG